MIASKPLANQALGSARTRCQSVVVRRSTNPLCSSPSARSIKLRASEGEPGPAKDTSPETSAARPPQRQAQEEPQRDIVIPILVAISLAGYAAVALIAFLDQ
ncbi:hypothetical protein HYH02_001099 [Chlamydomonas schloesseri]|uniref:Uncharacterized protein n=1 Tax=Chlamydomonas schloesseri TaxID=2026947 RepID=A0A836BCB6_9CHLO|nr:hypothetical protein HYH02_001099 [Chlamydomonas schloesseri]|eukprot:KAG2454058.1 hypothetical protein HYH02_001099 [Chlamydomonas schloesseri]